MADVAEHIYNDLRAWWLHRRGGEGEADRVANFGELEQKVVDGLHALFADAAAAEPGVDAAVGAALAGAGAPSEIASLAQSLVGALVNHFTAESQAKAAAAAAAAAAAQPAA